MRVGENGDKWRLPMTASFFFPFPPPHTHNNNNNISTAIYYIGYVLIRAIYLFGKIPDMMMQQ